MQENSIPPDGGAAFLPRSKDRSLSPRIGERTPQPERDIADHPSLKPQSFLRQVVHAALPLGEGIIVDPFMGSGSTVAAAEALGLHSIGVERYLAVHG
jgi:DNA modification methylase